MRDTIVVGGIVNHSIDSYKAAWIFVLRDILDGVVCNVGGLSLRDTPRLSAYRPAVDTAFTRFAMCQGHIRGRCVVTRANRVVIRDKASNIDGYIQSVFANAYRIAIAGIRRSAYMCPRR